MSIIFNGKNHDKVYFNGKYHDKIYHGSTLVWQKGTTEDPPAPTNLYSTNVTDMSGYIGEWATYFSGASASRTTYCACEPSTTYTITMNRTMPFRVTSSVDVPIVNGACTKTEQHANHNNSTPSTDTLTYTTSADAKYIGIYYWTTDFGTSTDVRNSIVVTKI